MPLLKGKTGSVPGSLRLTGDDITGENLQKIVQAMNAVHAGSVQVHRPPSILPESALRVRPRKLDRLADRIFGHVHCITQQKMDVILTVLAPRLGLLGASTNPILLWEDDEPEEEDQDKPDYWKFEDGVATIPIHGTLMKRTMGLSALSGLGSYESLQAKIAQAMGDPMVKGLIFDVESPGGEADGMFPLSDYIYSMRGTKPMFAVCNGEMCSAAYAIGSAADQIYTTRTACIGSVGCFMLHVDKSAADRQNGIKYTYIQAGEKKTDGNPHEPLSSTAEAMMQGEVNRIRNMFVDLVARNRNVTSQSVADTEAGVVFGDAGVPLFADKLGEYSDALADMKSLVNQPGDKEGPFDQPSSVLSNWTALPTATVESVTTVSDISGLVHNSGILTISDLFPACGPIAPHKTATVDKEWDGPANKGRLKNDGTASYYSKAYAWRESSGDGTKKNQFKFIHHEVSGDGTVGAANINGCRAGIGVINGARSGTTIPSGDRKGVYNHLAKHMRDGGVDPPDFKSDADLLKILAWAEGVEAEWLARPGTLAYQSANMTYGADRSTLLFGQPGVTLTVRRHISALAAAHATDRKINMLVVPYDGSLSHNLGGFREMYQPGCFSQGLSNDPRALFNHDEAKVLGRQSAGTAKFWEDAAGVHVEADAPETTWADDLLVSMRRGDITQASAAFWILQQRWETRNGEKVRIVEKALLRDASVLAYPAYESTQASVQPAASFQIPHGSIELARAKLKLLRLR